MARTVVALYDSVDDASKAIRDLVNNGFARDDISLMAGDSTGAFNQSLTATREVKDEEATNAAQGAGVGASIGAALGGIGGLLVGLGALMIPGIGPVVAAGPLAAALAGLAGAGAGALAGGVTGGLIGALMDAGVPEETAQYYSEGVRRGGALVTVRTDADMSGRAVAVMNLHNPVDINSRVSQWRQEGWAGFDSTTQHDASRDHEATGTVRSTVDTGLENSEERYGVDQNIPTTGDGDRTYGSAGATGQGYTGQGDQGAGTKGQNYSEGGSRGTEYGTTGGREGEMRHDYSSKREETDFGTSTTRGHDAGTGGHTRSEMGNEEDRPIGRDIMGSNRESRSSTTGTDYDSTRMSDRDMGTSGRADADYTGSGFYQPFSYYDTAFHNHFSSGTYGTTYSYDQYRPAYRYGYDLATDERYSNRDWSDIEPEARRYWEDREPGAWERMKDAVRHAWDSVRNAID